LVTRGYGEELPVSAYYDGGFDEFGRYGRINGRTTWLLDDPALTQVIFTYTDTSLWIRLYQSRTHDSWDIRTEGNTFFIGALRWASLSRRWRNLQWFVCDVLAPIMGIVDAVPVQYIADNAALLEESTGEPMYLMFHHAPKLDGPGDRYGAVYWETIQGYRLSVLYHKDEGKEGYLRIRWCKVGTRDEDWEQALTTESAVGMGFGILEEAQLGPLKVLVIDLLWMDWNIEPPESLKHALETVR
jgi:hypothetical protein